ncbi:cytochrome c biogenesis CcdA family protein [Laribacter hongkongensis]|uniref:cytochrome c biogenesis CcdA family protein n=1 Tax=Laribacter hongkongensis TaxID=168471 RepID=UPI0005A138B9|nr:cytochrome c biogenesis CcdA family protein [Laribacter hongkongensis]MCG8996419.1 cytochrome c biogenesis CcdA family protein [Laribacter hongkongensis]MCG9011762.1 cytochrome c biogenesis CcdA family protein [Laribacter hongkongensis]MCG9022768.1 cytochrome c biogenesis CcdA family protein [Laribacter hongkongensis]MCG9048382.1 cytochrome c biogenesis CcdA family protein [Laribacter hongkongensis]MCG9075224.1 cytochrome c biogenesis CcdA family protein [Laribacter hongkongensis]
MINAAELGLSWLAGSLTTLNPCVFPLLPLVLGGAMQANRWAPIAMGVGMVAMFATLGGIIGIAGDTLGIDPDLIRILGACLLIGFGLVMLIPVLNGQFTRLVTPLASNANAVTTRLDNGSLGGAFATGALLGMVWSPCSGPMLASAFTMVATEGGAARGTLILGMFGFGAASVLVAVAYISRRGFSMMRGWVLVHMDKVKKGFGLFVLMVGVAILSGGDKWLEAQLVRIMPQDWINLTTSL